MSKYSAHPTSIVHANSVGALSRIGAFTQLLSGAEVGEQTQIGSYCILASEASIGSLVLIGDGVAVPPGVVVEGRAVLGAHVAFEEGRSLTPAPRKRTRIREGARIGANATLVCGITVGRHALVEPGSYIREDVPDHARVGGEGQWRGWVCACGRELELAQGGDGRARCGCGRAFALDAGRLSEHTPIGR